MPNDAAICSIEVSQCSMEGLEIQGCSAGGVGPLCLHLLVSGAPAHLFCLSSYQLPWCVQQGEADLPCLLDAEVRIDRRMDCMQLHQKVADRPKIVPVHILSLKANPAGGASVVLCPISTYDGFGFDPHTGILMEDSV